MLKTETVLLPDNPEDALTIAHALIDPAVEPLLERKFGSGDLEPAIETAKALVVRTMDESMPTLASSEDTIWEMAAHASSLRQGTLGRDEKDSGPPSLPGDLADILSEPPMFADLQPRPFTPKESQIVLTALQKSARHKDPSAIDLLDRLSRQGTHRRTKLGLGRLAAVVAVGLIRPQ